MHVWLMNVVGAMISFQTPFSRCWFLNTKKPLYVAADQIPSTTITMIYLLVNKYERHYSDEAEEEYGLQIHLRRTATIICKEMLNYDYNNSHVSVAQHFYVM